MVRYVKTNFLSKERYGLANQFHSKWDPLLLMHSSSLVLNFSYNFWTNLQSRLTQVVWIDVLSCFLLVNLVSGSIPPLTAPRWPSQRDVGPGCEEATFSYWKKWCLSLDEGLRGGGSAAACSLLLPPPANWLLHRCNEIICLHLLLANSSAPWSSLGDAPLDHTVECGPIDIQTFGNVSHLVPMGAKSKNCNSTFTHCEDRSITVLFWALLLYML